MKDMDGSVLLPKIDTSRLDIHRPQDQSDNFWKIYICFKAAKYKGFTVFGLNNGGKCVGSRESQDKYMLGGKGSNTDCVKGTGSTDTNSVYEIRSGK